MQTQTIEHNETRSQARVQNIPNLHAIKAKQKATWESGDFGQIARTIENVAEDFMSRRSLPAGLNVLDVACGTGNLALIAARHGCSVTGIDIAENLLAQARTRAVEARCDIRFLQADAEELPLVDDAYDLTVSMFGVMFTPQPDLAVSELHRVTKPGGAIALANWTPEGFIGEMFTIFKTHLPPPPAGVPSPMDWGNPTIVCDRLKGRFTDLQLTRRIAAMQYPFPPAETVEFFRKYYGPTHRAFESLPAAAQSALLRDLVNLQTRCNIAEVSGTTEIAAEYLEVVGTKL
ncbi:MAG TPA: methyltransferase domain-containing protein [Verrucomicrobiae bacterium]|nr:methyltransferase domain-containing protein [Verrucomicrobiae bacterium]